MPRMCRRQFVSVIAAAVPILAQRRTLRAATAATSGTRALHFLHTHTGEQLSVEYAEGERYLPDALASVNRFLRDHRTGDVHPIDRGLLDLLHGLTQLTDTRRPFQVISGYRSPGTNAMLRRASGGVAGRSLHMVGQAIDIRLADVPLGKLRAAALAAGRGGVGYYPASDFVHVDTGRVRHW
jgi:uncharacterized protein YcbK (DUF882 family)